MASMYLFLLLWSILSWLVFTPVTLLVSFLPRRSDRRADVKTMKEYTRKIAEEMHVVGLMNMQYAIEDGKVFVLEANPRASRTVPLVSKVCNINMVQLATDIVTSDLTPDVTIPVPDLKEKNIRSLRCKGSGIPLQYVPGG